MLNKLQPFIHQYRMLEPGDRVICAVSGGADSVALLFAMYLLAPKLDITLEAAHFNHCLRGEESAADAQFVVSLCDRLDIPLHMGQGSVVAGKKGLEAAARNARYGFLESLDGKIATAHTADDNAETVLMHLVRGTGLKGLGGIAPVRGKVIRPMLTVTRQEVIDFLQDQNLTWREDSSNAEDVFLRNRLRHRVMPLLMEENPSLAQNLSDMALRLREDEALLTSQAEGIESSASVLRQQHYAVRSRWIHAFLNRHGFPDAGKEHIDQIDRLIFSQKPSAQAKLPGGLTVARCYDRLQVVTEGAALQRQILQIPCSIPVPGTDSILHISHAETLSCQKDCFTVAPQGQLILRSRRTGDSIRLSGGTKSLKKLFIDDKIPAINRGTIPVLADDVGVLWVMGFGPNLDRLASDQPALEIRLEKKEMEE